MQPFGVVILAGGSGVRFGGSKAFVEFDGKPLWMYPFDVAVRAGCKEILVVFPHGFDLEDPDYVRSVSYINGGRGRARDCLSALEHIDSRRVVVLEAARPLVTREQILRLAGGLYPNIIYGKEMVNTFYNQFNNEYYHKSSSFELLGTGGYDTELLRSAYNEMFSFVEPDNNYPCDSWVMKYIHDIESLVWSVGLVNNLFKVTYPHHLKMLGVIKENMGVNNGFKD